VASKLCVVVAVGGAMKQRFWWFDVVPSRGTRLSSGPDDGCDTTVSHGRSQIPTPMVDVQDLADDVDGINKGWIIAEV
jgi:hypothetical protein